MFDLLNDVVNNTVPAGGRVSQASTLSGFLNMLANALLIIVVGIAFIGLGFSFFQYIISMGDPKSVQKARDAMIWSFMALIIAGAAFAIKIVLMELIGPANEIRNF
jgi:hypothetical protein